MTTKPPFKLMIERIQGRMRSLSILAAIGRYVDSNKEVPEEWIEELKTLPDTKDRGFLTIEAEVHRYNVGVDPKKIGVRVMRF